jgi:hypothetical protein
MSEDRRLLGAVLLAVCVHACAAFKYSLASQSDTAVFGSASPSNHTNRLSLDIWQRQPCELGSAPASWLESRRPVALGQEALPSYFLERTQAWVTTCEFVASLSAGVTYLVDVGSVRPGQDTELFPSATCDGRAVGTGLLVQGLGLGAYGASWSFVSDGCMYTRFTIQPNTTVAYPIQTLAMCGEPGITGGCAGDLGVWTRAVNDDFFSIAAAAQAPALARKSPPLQSLPVGAMCSPLTTAETSGSLMSAFCSITFPSGSPASPLVVVVGTIPGAVAQRMKLVITFDPGANSKVVTLLLAKTSHEVALIPAGGSAFLPPLGAVSVEVPAGAQQNFTLKFLCRDGSNCKYAVQSAYVSCLSQACPDGMRASVSTAALNSTFQGSGAFYRPVDSFQVRGAPPPDPPEECFFRTSLCPFLRRSRFSGGSGPPKYYRTPSPTFRPS